MIHINLIPNNLWNLNLRNILGPEKGAVLSLRIREQQHGTCQACGISIVQLKARKGFHAHEVGKFNETVKEVTLDQIVCLCAHCHTATHMGLASIKHQEEKAMKHLCKVNQGTTTDAVYYLEACFEQGSKGSQVSGKFNIANLPTGLFDEEKKLFELFLHQHNLVC